MHYNPNLSLTYSVLAYTPLINKNENNYAMQIEQDTSHIELVRNPQREQAKFVLIEIIANAFFLTRYGIFYAQCASTGAISSCHRLLSSLHLFRYGGLVKGVTHQRFHHRNSATHSLYDYYRIVWVLLRFWTSAYEN